MLINFESESMILGLSKNWRRLPGFRLVSLHPQPQWGILQTNTPNSCRVLRKRYLPEAIGKVFRIIKDDGGAFPYRLGGIGEQRHWFSEDDICWPTKAWPEKPSLGPPVVRFYPFSGEGSPTKGYPYSNLSTGGPRRV